MGGKEASSGFRSLKFLNPMIILRLCTYGALEIMKSSLILMGAVVLFIWGCRAEGNQGQTGKSGTKAAKEVNVVKIKDKAAPPVKGLLDEPVSKLIEVTPPTKPGEMGMTANQQRGEGPPKDPSKVVMTPPSKAGGSTMTVEQFNEMQTGKEKFDPNKAEVVPPSKPGEKGVTVAEFERKRASQSREKVNPGELLVVPPGKPGEKGMTVSEVEALRKADPPVPSSEIPPPPIRGENTNIGTGQKTKLTERGEKK
jgi:hypothetical protein